MGNDVSRVLGYLRYRVRERQLFLSSVDRKFQGILRIPYPIDWIGGEECREITKFNLVYRLPISDLLYKKTKLCLTKYFVTDQSYAKGHKVAWKFQ